MTEIIIPQTFYIYTLSNPITGDVFYVGKSTNPKNRYYGHVSCAKRGVDTMPVYDIIRTMDCKPVLTVVDSITTIHETLAFKLEACWRWISEQDGNELSNKKKHGYVSNHNKALEFTAIIKRFAESNDLSELYEIEIRDAYFEQI